MFSRDYRFRNLLRQVNIAKSIIVGLFLIGSFIGGSAYGQLDVWIDPGHGGNDPGALGIDGASLPNEKELNIGVAYYLENDLTGLGYFVYRTQNYDTTFYQPSQRREIANGERPNDQGIQLPCRLLVSIHMNSSTNSAAMGTETYYATIKYDAKKRNAYLADKSAAEEIHADLMTYANVAFLFCSSDRGIKPANFAILRRTRAPALLFEVCFISNGCQFNNIITSGDQALIADGIAAGVSGYLGESLQKSKQPSQVISSTQVLSKPTPKIRVESLQEDFEGTTFPPTGWEIQTEGLGIPYEWHRTTDSIYVNSGSGAALVGGESPDEIDEWLISPSILLGSAESALKFLWSGSQIWSTLIDVSLNIREVGTLPWTRLWSIANDEPRADPFICRERIVDLTAWNGINVEFGFWVVGTNGADFALDNIVVGDFYPTAGAPNDACSNATVLGNVFSIQDVTCYASDDLDPFTSITSSCVSDRLDGPDVFYEIAVAFGDSLHASLSAEWGAGLYIVDDCTDPICIAGAYAEDGRTFPTLDYRFMNSGTYYLVIDGEDGSCGPYQLEGEIIPTITGVVEEEDVTTLSLAVNPNPAGSTISFFSTFPIVYNDTPIIEIFNVAGKRIMRMQGPRDCSAFSYTWDKRDMHGSPVASGIYFVRLRVGREEAVRKLVILR